MLLSFRAANHRSLRDEQQLLLTPAYEPAAPADTPWEALTVAGIFGPNASGKSNVIDALQYMADMVHGSFRESEPGGGVERHPFALDPGLSEEPSTFVVDVELDKIRYTYGFALDDVRIIEEWMYSYPNKRKRTIFHRKGDDYTYGEHSPEGLRQVEQLTEPNVLFLSVAVRSKQDILRPVYAWFSNIRYLSPQRPYRHRVIDDFMSPSELKRLSTLLRAADTGIEALELIDETEEEFTARIANYPKTLERTPPRRKRLVFRHRGAAGDVMLRPRDQSLGTQTLYGLSVPAFSALDKGTLLVVDELDSSLHPFLTAQLIGLFRDPATNPRGAQLIFTSHDVSLLGRIQGQGILQRDHVWFTEKDDSGATELFPLSEFKPRKDENRERRYLAGRYGAVPVINDELFVAAIAAREDSDVSEDS
ncbi:ATP/GTP-binding protein [Spirillospora sp. NPDC048911]|uniref:AAA family ATPase n=1 Tax=Spirillospora sp. NPDC048911 TaxID=3364527 RepID=UPI00371BC4FA